MPRLRRCQRARPACVARLGCCSSCFSRKGDPNPYRRVPVCEKSKGGLLRQSILPLAASWLISGACGGVPVDPGPDGIPLGSELGLVQSRMLWENQGIGDYDAAVERVCECRAAGGPVMVVVRSGAVTILDPDSGEPVDTSVVGGYPTVDGLFDILQNAFDRNADEIRVLYDTGLGYPLEFHIDFYADAIDEELGYVVSSLVPRR